MCHSFFLLMENAPKKWVRENAPTALYRDNRRILAYKRSRHWKNWHIVQLNGNKFKNRSVKLVWGILEYWNIDFWCRFEFKARHIDAFLVSSGLDTGDPNEKKKNLKKKIWPKNERECPAFLKIALFLKIIPKKIQKELIAQNWTQTFLLWS